MNSKLILVLVLILASIINSFSQEREKKLGELINEAISVSPKISMLKAKLGVVSSRIEQGTNLPDPMLTLGVLNLPTNSFSFTQEPMTGKVIGLSQAIPYPTGLSAAAKLKSVDTLIVHQEIKDAKNKIRKNVSRAYYDLQYSREELRLNSERISLLTQILEVVKTKYEVGEASMQNIINVELELTRIADNIEKIRGRENSLVAELNTILLRENNKSVLTEKLSTTEFNVIGIEALIMIASENDPKLKEIKLSERKASLMEKVAEYEFYPNFNFGVQYSQRDQNNITGIEYNDLLSVTAGISLPINYGGKKTAKVNEAKYLQDLFQEKYSGSIQELRKSISKIEAKLVELHSRNNLILNTLLPLAEQSLVISLSDFQVGKIDFVNVINAEKEIINVKTELIKLQRDYNNNIVMLEYLVGTTLPLSMNVNGDLK